MSPLFSMLDHSLISLSPQQAPNYGVHSYVMPLYFPEHVKPLSVSLVLILCSLQPIPLFDIKEKTTSSGKRHIVIRKLML